MQDLYPFFKSMIDNDNTSIVVCNCEHIIIYMNDAAKKNYSKYGSENLIGRSLFDCHNASSCKKIKDVVKWFGESKTNNIVHTFYSASKNKDVYMIALRDENGDLIGYYEKHEFRDRDLSPFYDISK